MANKLTTDGLVKRVSDYFEAYPDETTVIIAEDGNCFKASSVGRNRAANHKRLTELKLYEVAKGKPSDLKELAKETDETSSKKATGAKTRKTTK